MTHKKTKKISKLKKNEIKKTIGQWGLVVLNSVLGGLAIVLGTIACKVCPYPELAPLLFALGIGLCMAFDFALITRYVPTAKKIRIPELITILVVNLAVARIAGLFSPLTYTIPDNLFSMSVAGGIVIGLVSWNNLLDTKYKVALYLLIMYAFIELGLCHCVVLAFLGLDLPHLLIVVAGNLLGGMFVRLSIKAQAKLG